MKFQMLCDLNADYPKCDWNVASLDVDNRENKIYICIVISETIEPEPIFM